MPRKFTHSAPGNKFVLTALGLQEPRVRVKFNENNPNNKAYSHSVPLSWVMKGWVEEVKDV